MSMERQARPVTLAWSNPVVRWWGFLSFVSAANIAVWFALYRQFHEQSNGSFSNTSGIGLMMLLCAAYVFGCAFRSVLPRADVQRICLFDHWLSSVMVGRTVATVAEVCFAAQWAIILHQLGTMTGAETTVNIAWTIVPLIMIAECFSWYAVLTTHYLCNAIENSIWAVVFFLVGIALCRLLPEFHGPVRWAFIVAIVGQGVIAGSYWQSFGSYASTTDLWICLGKSVIFGFVVVVIASRRGLEAAGGARGVADAVNAAVVLGIVASMVINVIITQVTTLFIPPQVI